MGHRETRGSKKENISEVKHVLQREMVLNQRCPNSSDWSYHVHSFISNTDNSNEEQATIGE